ncbi:MAG: type II secretion system F family protein [Planctomycetia bacterium]|nr:type II secretion system F family protein [Planctomycetia bacterium]
MQTFLITIAAFVSALLVAGGLIVVFKALFAKKLTPEQLRNLEIERAEAEAIEKLVQKNKRGGFDQWFATMLEEGGSALSPLTASLIVVATTLLLGGCAFVFSNELFLGLGVGMVAMTLPIAFWMAKRAWRISQMRKQLPETLEAIGDAIRGGLGLEAAIDMTSEQTEEPLRAEFKYAGRQLAMGQAPDHVMERMARRIPITEFRIFTTAVLVHRRTGGNLAMLAERLARSARDRAEFYGHLKAISAGSRMSIIGLLIVTACAIVFLSGLDWSYVYRFVANPYGPALLGVSIGLLILGGVWAWSIMRVRY